MTSPVYHIWEHVHSEMSFEYLDSEIVASRLFEVTRGRKDTIRYCFEILDKKETSFKVKTAYFIGVDWIIPNKHSIVVHPKLDSDALLLWEKIDADTANESEIPTATGDKNFVSIDYFDMLNDCLSEPYLYSEIDDLVNIDWNAPEINIPQEHDFLTPLLVVQFLNILHGIVRKGLRKSYYKVTQNLTSKIKGKVLVAANVKQNITKNKLTQTICQFDEFGLDSPENRMLHKALLFCHSYIDNHGKVFQDNDAIKQHMSYCKAAFYNVSSEVNFHEVKQAAYNPFFKDYQQGLHLAEVILKRFSFSISKTTDQQISTPPYWIDMPRLFELYAFHFLKQKFGGKDELTYHWSTYGNELDFLVNTPDHKMVVDAKYKPQYSQKAVHEDIRQVAGYARLDYIYKELKIETDKLIDCLIIYPKIADGIELKEMKGWQPGHENSKIKGYNKVYKLGIKLPVVQRKS